MTIPSTDRKAGPLLGTGAQTAWPFTFKVFAEADILVTIADSDGVETELVLDTDYSVTLNGNQDTSPGGEVTYPIAGDALPVGSVLVMVGNLDYDQPLDIPGGGSFSPVAFENELDRLTMQIQQLKELIGRAIKSGVTTDVDSLLPPPVSLNLIGWNEAATALQNFEGTFVYIQPAQAFSVAASDEYSAITVGTAKVTRRCPFALSALSVSASLTTAQVSGTIFTVDIKVDGVSILSTLITIDNGEKTSATALTPAVLNVSTIALNAEITIDVTQIGNSTATGLKVDIIGTPAL